MRDLKIRLVYNYEDTIRTGCHIQARERTHWYTCNLTAFNGTIERIKFTGIPQSSKKKALCSTLSNLYLSLSDDERATAANVHRRRRCNQSLSPVRSINTSNLSRQSGDAQSPVYPGDFTDGDHITSPILSTNQDMITDELKPSEIPSQPQTVISGKNKWVGNPAYFEALSESNLHRPLLMVEHHNVHKDQYSTYPITLQKPIFCHLSHTLEYSIRETLLFWSS